MLNVPTLPRVRQAANVPQLPMSPGMSAMPPLNYASSRTRQRLTIRQQLASFQGWQYVTVDLICRCCSTIFPEVGRKRSLIPGEPAVSQQRREILQAGGIYLNRNETFETLDDHRMIDLLRKPSPEKGATWTRFAYEYHMYRELCGEAIVWIIPDQLGLPAALWTVPNDCIHRKEGNADIWIIDVGTGALEVPGEQLMRGTNPDPLNKGGAYSATQAIAPWLMSSEAIDTAQFQSFSTDIFADWAMLLDKDAYPTVDKKGLALLKEIFMDRASGVHNMGPLPLPPGVREMKQLRNKPHEMDFQDSGDSVRDKVMSSRAVNKFSAGISADMNRGDTQEAQTAFWTYCGDPRNIVFGDLLTTQIAQQFDPTLIVLFRSGRPIDREQELREDQILMNYGGQSPDELAMKHGLKPLGIPESAGRYIVSTVIPLDPKLRPEPVAGDAAAVLDDEANAEPGAPDERTGD